MCVANREPLIREGDKNKSEKVRVWASGRAARDGPPFANTISCLFYTRACASINHCCKAAAHAHARSRALHNKEKWQRGDEKYSIDCNSIRWDGGRTCGRRSFDEIKIMNERKVFPIIRFFSFVSLQISYLTMLTSKGCIKSFMSCMSSSFSHRCRVAQVERRMSVRLACDSCVIRILFFLKHHFSGDVQSNNYYYLIINHNK